MGAGRVRQGQVYVEIGADPAKFFAALNRVNKRIAGLGRELSNVGAGITGAGLALAAPFVAGVAAATKFQDTLLAVQASTGATAGQLDAVRSASMQMSAALSVGPAEAAASMLELLKAGMSLDAVLGGAGEAAIQFAKVGQMDVAKAAVVMSDAMNVFGVSASVAANTISAAADASSTSIEQMAESFAMSSAVAALANQSIGDLSTALAILANNGVKGSDAGTSIKTMLMRLMAPADEAIGALGQLGLTVRSFRNADGSMRPMVEIIGTLTRAMDGMDQAAKDDIFRRVFGQDAIRAAAILTSVGVDGFNAMQDGMDGALSVGEKYKTMMSGLTGAGAALSAAMQRLGIVLGETVGGALLSLMPPILGTINALSHFVKKNGELVGKVGRASAILVVVGGALTGIGLSLQAASFGMGGFLKAIAALISPFTLIARLGISLGVSVAAGVMSAVSALAAYTAAAAAAAVAAIASASACAAAWLAPAAPVIAVVAAIGLAAAGAVAFGDSIKSALSGVGDLVGTVAGYIGSGFNQAVSDGTVVFGDLYRTATTTFGGIYDALSAGDLAGAMDILWGGLIAGWLRGQEAIMGFIDPWISAVQNLFTDLGTNIAILWDQLWTALATNTIGATILGIFDNIAVGVMAVWDTLVTEIKKAWVTVQGFISGAKDTKERVAKIDNEKQARAEQRRQNMPGVNERVRRANEEGDKMRADAAARQGAMVDNANGIKAGRKAENASRAAGRRAATVAAEQSVEGKRRNAAEKRSVREQAGALEQEIAQVSDMDALHELAAQFHALAASGHLTQEQIDKMRESLGHAQERIEGQASDQATASRDAAKAGADAAGKDVQQSKAEAVGTFSAFAADRMGFGSTLQERIAKAAEETATNTRGMQPALVGQ
jgi:TP901 family phage tail tape measure protein